MISNVHNYSIRLILHFRIFRFILHLKYAYSIKVPVCNNNFNHVLGDLPTKIYITTRDVYNTEMLYTSLLIQQ